MKKIIVFIILLFSISNIKAQLTITGTVVDAQNLEPLPAAHIVIKGTYKGTVANADGNFRIKLDSLPTTLVVRFLGYKTKEQTINVDFSDSLVVYMEEAYLEMEEIVVTGEDPAISIMKEVIRRKKIWRENLNNYSVEAYSRQQLKTDTSIVSITESISEAYWDKEFGHREILKSKRQTANIEASDNFAGVSYLPNFYDDNVEVSQFDVVGVTHPDALSYYNFELVNFSKIDDKIIFEIDVTSKRKLQPLFEGTIFVQDQDYALISVRIKPNDVIVFPPPVKEFDSYYEQQFNNFGGDYWLPVDFRLDGKVKVGLPGIKFPPIGFKQITKLSDYKVNTQLPDTIFKKDWFTVDSTTIDTPDSLFKASVNVIPLSNVELEAYESIDSTATLEKAFQPTGFLVWLLRLNDDDNDDVSGNAQSDSTRNTKKPSFFSLLTQNISLSARYNRVDALYGGLKHERKFFNNRLQSQTIVGYSMGYEALNFEQNITWAPLINTKRFQLNAGYKAITNTRYHSDLFNKELLTGMALLGYTDYFDYYRQEGVYLGSSYNIQNSSSKITAQYVVEHHSSIDYETSYDIMGSSLIQRINPPINEGNLSSLLATYEGGQMNQTFGIIGVDNLKIDIEKSFKVLGSDWDFTRFNINLYQRFPTFFQRRFIPNTLDIRINAGTYIGDLPVQKNGAIDVALGYFTPFGAFKSKRDTPYEGASYIAIHAEHNFRSIPFEALGIPNAAKRGLSLIVFGSAGRTWLSKNQQIFFGSQMEKIPSNAEKLHSEIGVSLSNIFSLIRIDVVYRLDEPGIYPGIALTRLF